jgi:hypothetical protein
MTLAIGVLAGCEDPPPRGTVAQVGAWTLTEVQLAELLVLAQPFPLDSVAVGDLARHWISVAALAHRVGAGEDLLGDDAMEVSTWLERREAILAADRSDRLGLTPLPDPQITYRTGELRLMAHVLRRVGSETSAAEVDLQRRTAERLFATLIDGGPWDNAVAESQDLETRDASGLLGLFAAGELPQELDEVARRMEPGQVSSVVRSPIGFHILYRPRYEDVAGLFAVRLSERRLAEAEAQSRLGLLVRRHAVYPPEAVATVRRLAADPWAAVAAGADLATWDGGTLSAEVVRRYLIGLPSAAREEMLTVEESSLQGFIEGLAVRELRIQDAEAGGLALDEGTAADLRAQHDSEVEHWMTVLELSSGEEANRRSLDRYMEDMVSRQVEARSLPPLFEAWLLEGVDWRLQATGISGAIAGARAMLVGVG